MGRCMQADEEIGLRWKKLCSKTCKIANANQEKNTLPTPVPNKKKTHNLLQNQKSLTTLSDIFSLQWRQVCLSDG